MTEWGEETYNIDGSYHDRKMYSLYVYVPKALRNHPVLNICEPLVTLYSDIRFLADD